MNPGKEEGFRTWGSGHWRSSCPSLMPLQLHWAGGDRRGREKRPAEPPWGGDAVSGPSNVGPMGSSQQVVAGQKPSGGGAGLEQACHQPGTTVVGWWRWVGISAACTIRPRGWARESKAPQASPARARMPWAVPGGPVPSSSRQEPEGGHPCPVVPKPPSGPVGPGLGLCIWRTQKAARQGFLPPCSHLAVPHQAQTLGYSPVTHPQSRHSC